MDYLVIDSSIALGLCFEDHINATVLRSVEYLRKHPAIVTPEWHAEVAELLLLAEKKKRISAADREAFLNLLRCLQVETDHHGARDTWGASYALALEHNLHMSEAQALLLALRRKARLASLRPELNRAAKKLGVMLVLEESAV